MTLTRDGIAYRVALELTEGSYVNLGVGIPSLVPSYLPPDREIFIHNENGVLGVGPLAAPGAEDPDLVSANKEFITMRPGAAVFDHAISFAMIRGGHLTHAVMGAMEVAANGDMANWRVPGQKVPGVGGAMDLAFGVQNVWIAMTHVTTSGEPKILTRCSCPLTAPRCVRRIFTDIAIIDVAPDGLVLREVARGCDPQAVRARTGAPLRIAEDCREMEIPEEVNGVRLVV